MHPILFMLFIAVGAVSLVFAAALCAVELLIWATERKANKSKK